MANHAQSTEGTSGTLGVITVVGALFMPVIFPLVMWLAQRKQNETVEGIAKETLNFQLTFIVGSIVTVIGLTILSFVGAYLGGWLGGFLGVTLWGLAYITLGIAYLVLMVKAAIKASNHEVYRFPFIVRVIR